MKVYSIGRDADCDIIINDQSNVVSRRHASLYVSPLGKMTIVDVSQNGTYVNGIRVSQNVPFPVTRKDSVSFAHIATLEWSAIPNPLWYVKYVAGGIIAVMLIIIGCLAFCGGGEEKSGAPTAQAPSDSIAAKDTTKEKKADEGYEPKKPAAQQNNTQKATPKPAQQKPAAQKPAANPGSNKAAAANANSKGKANQQQGKPAQGAHL